MAWRKMAPLPSLRNGVADRDGRNSHGATVVARRKWRKWQANFENLIKSEGILEISWLKLKPNPSHSHSRASHSHSRASSLLCFSLQLLTAAAAATPHSSSGGGGGGPVRRGSTAAANLFLLLGLKSFNPPSHLSILHPIFPMKDKHLKKRLKTMAELDKDGEMSIEDAAWLCSLSESEIDMLISLKLLIIQRAKMIGYANLANKFDLKMIRAIAFVLMEHVKEEVKGSSLIPDTVKSAAFLDACNLLKCDNEVPATIEEELSTNIGTDMQTFLSSSPISKRKKRKVRSRD